MKLSKPLIYHDLETTGVSTENDRIVEIAAIKYFPDGSTEEKHFLINPEIPIPLGAAEVHGITDDKIKDAPTFKQLAVSMRSWFDGCDLAGYNSDRFDVLLLSAEFERAGLEGITWNPALLDIFTMYRKLFPNTLSDVYKRLTGKVLEGAHGAINDIRSTKEIADILIPSMIELSETPLETVVDFDNYMQGSNKRYDLAGKLYKDEEGVVRYNFGKDLGKSVKEFPGFGQWMLNQSFPQETKNKLKELIYNK